MNKYFLIYFIVYITNVLQVIVDNLEQGETYKVTVATMVDGYTTDKHAAQVETYKDTTDTMLFPVTPESTMEEVQGQVCIPTVL